MMMMRAEQILNEYQNKDKTVFIVNIREYKENYFIGRVFFDYINGHMK